MLTEAFALNCRWHGFISDTNLLLLFGDLNEWMNEWNYYCYCHHHFLPPTPTPLLFRHFYFMWFVSYQAYINLCVPKALPPSILPYPSFFLHYSFPDLLLQFDYILPNWNFYIVLCSKPLELYLHSFLKHTDIIFIYFLSQKLNIACVI